MMAIYEKHFEAEEALFTTIRDNKHDIADHRHRHLGLMNTVKGAQLPISEEMTEYIKNWLAHQEYRFHIQRPSSCGPPCPNPLQVEDEHGSIFSFCTFRVFAQLVM